MPKGYVFTNDDGTVTIAQLINESILIECIVDEGAGIGQGKGCYLKGSLDGVPLVALASISNPEHRPLIGVSEESKSDTQDIRLVSRGYVPGVDTLAMDGPPGNGSILYLGEDGDLVPDKTDGIENIQVGGITETGSSGVAYVDIISTVDSGVLFTEYLDANSALYPSSNPAAAASRNGHPIIAFDDTTAESVLFGNRMPNSYGGEDIKVDIDWVAETATTGGVTWGVEFERDAPGGNDIDSDSFAAQQTGTSTTNGTSGVITRTTITLTQAEADSVAASDYFRMRVQRVTGDGGDTMTDDAEIVKISLRV